MYASAVLLGLWAAFAAGPQTTEAQREPLRDGRGRVVFEGRRIILPSDSHPRPPARIVAGPTVARDGRRVRIGFTLDKPDDVLVRVVDPEGNVVRMLGCGVLGSNAPPPFSKESLEQSIDWDGNDEAGSPAPPNSRIQVSVGLTPRFRGFVGHDPAQLLSQIIWLEVDPQGRLYVQVGAARKTDPSILRFDRDGKYVDMVYPSNPRTLAETGRKIEDVWPFVARYGDESIPHRPRAWPSFVPYRSDPLIPFPMRIAGDGTVYFAESTTGYPKWAGDGEPFRLFTTHVDHFWFLQMMPLMYSIGPFAIDGKGYGYIVTSTADRATGTYPSTLETLNDPKAPGTIRKVNLRTGELQADFEYNGEERLDEPSAYLGVTQTVPSAWKRGGPRRQTPDRARDDHQRFPDLVDLSVDPRGRILIIDGWPRRVKSYEANGRFLGELAGLEVQGRRREFKDLRGIAWARDGFYLLGIFRGEGDDDETAFLARCRGELDSPKPVWIAPLDAGARRLAVDRTADPALIWVGMGNGAATLSRIADLGERGFDARHFGGLPERAFRYPWNIAADSDGYLYVHDRDRESLVRTNLDLTDWKERPLRGAPVSMLADERNKRLLLSYSLGENGNYTRERLEEQAGFLSFDLRTLERLPFRLQPVYDQEELARRDGLFRQRNTADYPWTKTYGGQFAGVDAQGNLYVRDAARGQSWHKAGPSANAPQAGVIRKYAPSGRILDEAHCRLFHTGGGVSMDSRGNFYAVELPRFAWASVVHDLPAGIVHQKLSPALRRGEQPLGAQTGFTHLVKMNAAGGERDTDAELWAHRGVSGTNGGGCYCDWPDMQTAVDGADRLFAADVDLHMVKVLDTAGNMLARIGRWGNAETVPGSDGDARELGFRLIYCVAAAGDDLFVSDKDLRRIARIRMTYRTTREAAIPSGE